MLGRVGSGAASAEPCSQDQLVSHAQSLASQKERVIQGADVRSRASLNLLAVSKLELLDEKGTALCLALMCSNPDTMEYLVIKRPKSVATTLQPCCHSLTAFAKAPMYHKSGDASTFESLSRLMIPSRFWIQLICGGSF